MQDKTIYKHTQYASLHLVILAFLFIIVAWSITSFSDLGIISLFNSIPLLLIFGINIWIFRSLTVEITAGELTWYYGPGLWKFRLSRSDITSIKQVNLASQGILGMRIAPGIRFSTQGWVFSANGWDGIQVTTKDGKSRCIGSNDTQQLLEALS